MSESKKEGNKTANNPRFEMLTNLQVASKTLQDLSSSLDKAMEEYRKSLPASVKVDRTLSQLIKDVQKKNPIFASVEPVDLSVSVSKRLNEIANRAATLDSKSLSAIAGFPPLSLEIGSGITHAMKQYEKTLMKNQSLFRELQTQQFDWSKLIGKIPNTGQVSLGLSSIGNASIVWKLGVEKSLNQIALGKGLLSSQSCISRMLEPSRVFTDFVQRTQESLQRSLTQDHQKALKASLNLAQTQYLTNVVAGYPTVEVVRRRGAPLPPSTLNLFKIQQKELLYEPDLIEDAEDLRFTRPPNASLVSDIASQVLVLVNSCNDLWCLGRDGDLFKPTRTVLVAFAELPLTLAANKSALGNVIDYFYFIFYEGSGEMNRLLKDKEGVLEDKDCGVIWAVKHLRNCWLRHDPDHGGTGKIAKKKENLKESLEWLGFSRLPTRAEEYLALQRKLLEEFKAFLEVLVRKLSGE